jgi:protein O-mannosyl-transferase
MLNERNINPDKRIVIVYIVLALAILAVFWQVHQFDFVNLDDDKYVTQNAYVRSGITLNGLCWAFSTTYAQYWHPVTWLSLMFDYQLYGLNAGGYHVTNLIVHILSTLLLFGLFNRMTGEIWKSAFVAALFALHPLRVESVAWVAKRRDILCIFFSILTLCLYVYYTEKPVIKRYLLVFFSFALALMSKPMAVTLPLVMILLDYWPLGRFQAKQGNAVFWQSREKISFFILSGAFSIITLHAHHDPSMDHFSFYSRLANAIVSFAMYLEKTFWPHNLTVLQMFSAQLPVGQVLYSSLLIIIVSVFVMTARKRFPYLFVGWLWYAITILPTLGIVQFGHLAISDHHTYLPSIGIAVGMAWGIPLLFPGEGMRGKILFPAGISVVAILAVLTWQQCGYWKNTVELLNRTCLLTEKNYMAHNNLASALAEKGKMEEAIDNYNKAIRIKPDLYVSYSGRGLAYDRLGQDQRAVEDYNHAILLKPDYAEAYFNRGNSYDELGRYQQAINDYNEAIRLNPSYMRAYNNRGNTYFSKGNHELGCHDAQKACEMGNCRLLELAKSQKRCR